jgi:hypothetical protein
VGPSLRGAGPKPFARSSLRIVVAGLGSRAWRAHPESAGILKGTETSHPVLATSSYPWIRPPNFILPSNTCDLGPIRRSGGGPFQPQQEGVVTRGVVGIRGGTSGVEIPVTKKATASLITG